MQEKLLYKIPEVCAITGLGRSTIYTLLDQPDGLETVRIGRAVRIAASEVERWVQEQSSRQHGTASELDAEAAATNGPVV